MTTLPAATPVTTPDVPTVAIDGLALLHVPPPEASVNVMVLPGQTVDGPEITPELAFTVTV